MKTCVWLVMLLVTVASVATAQTRPAPPNDRPGDRPGVQLLERIRYSLADLKLSDEQKVKVDDIFKSARESMDGMREKMRDLEPRQRMEEGEKFFKSVRDELAAVLDKTQIETLDKKLEAARENLRNRFGPGRGAPATTGPRPDARPGPGPGAGAGPMRPGEMMERLRTAIPKLQLNDSQRQEIRALLEDVQSRGQMLRQQAEAGGEDVRVKAREMIEETRTKVNKILTPEQQEKLRSLMGDPSKPAAGATASTKAAMMMEGDDMMSAGEKKSSRKTGGPFTGVGDSTKAQIGSPAPAFALKKTDGSLVQLSSLKGRVIVLEFGSYTCPAFRDRVGAMEKLKTDYSTRAQFFVVYTKEAHAKGEWEVSRNKDNEIAIDQPATMDARVTVAKKSRDELKLTTPILVDNMENETATAYGAGPNSAVVINRDGVIVHKQQWFDPAGLRRAIDEAAKATPTTQPNL